MPSLLPPEIVVENEGQDVRYLLPVRPLGKARTGVGFFFIAFGLVFAIAPASSEMGSLKHLVHGNGHLGDWISCVFLLPFIAAGLLTVAIGLCVMFGRCRVEWCEKRLSVLEIAGPIRWRRRLQKSPLRKLTVSVGTNDNGKPVTTGPLAKMGALVAEFEEGKRRMVTIGYPADWLDALARDLSIRVGAFSPSVGAPKVELIDSAQAQAALDQAAQKPANTAITLEPLANGTSFTIPAAGLRKGSRGLIGFASIWCLFMTVFTTFGVLLGNKPSDPTPCSIWLLLTAFWGIGIAMLAKSIDMGRSQVRISADRSQLVFTKTGPFGKKEKHWPRESIKAIRADHSGMEMNNQALLQLQIHPIQGKKVGLLTGRSGDELRWIAVELRRVLNVPSRV